MKISNYKIALVFLTIFYLSCSSDDESDNPNQKIINSFTVETQSIPLKYALFRFIECTVVNDTNICVQKLTFLSDDFTITEPNNENEVDFTGDIGDGVGLIFYSNEEKSITGEFTFSSSINELNTFSGGYGINYDLLKEEGEGRNIINGTLRILENAEDNYTITIENGLTDENKDFSLIFEGNLLLFKYEDEPFQF